MRTFEARYHGTCPACESHIPPGALVTYDDDVVVHADCSTDAPPRRTRPICDRCHLEATRVVDGLCPDCA